MPPRILSTVNQKTRERLARLDNSDLNSSAFWVGHLLMIAATVFGVYLAAHTGFSQAMLFNELKSKQSNYYLRQSLYDELTDNVALLRHYHTTVLTQSPGSRELQQHRPALSLFVWETMKTAPNTLETPSHILRGARQFYRDVESIVDKTEQRIYSSRHAAEQLALHLDRMEQKVLPALQQNIDTLASSLADYQLIAVKETHP